MRQLVIFASTETIKDVCVICGMEFPIPDGNNLFIDDGDGFEYIFEKDENMEAGSVRFNFIGPLGFEEDSFASMIRSMCAPSI